MNLLDLMTALQTGVEAMLILLGISLGATLPDVLCHQYIERSKRKNCRNFWPNGIPIWRKLKRRLIWIKPVGEDNGAP